MRLATLAGLLALLASSASAQTVYSLSGRVVDDRLQEGVPGASVLLAGTSFGAATDFEGRFAFDASVTPGDYTLRVSFVGYRTVEVPVALGAQRSVDVGTISVVDDALRSDEVIVSATGLPVERRQLGNAIGTVDARDIADVGATAVDQVLVGKVAGAVVSQNSGNPAGGISIRLRGPSTVLGSADPLYIVDGVLVDNSSSNDLLDLGGGGQNRLVDINPEDIERIEVLKGASAAALYGSRANNGVIQIFTKRGRLGTPRISLSTSVRADAVRKTLEVNRAEFAAPINPSNPTAERTRVDRFDYQDDIFQQALGTEQFLSVSGGEGNTTYYLSGGHFANEGIVRGNLFRRATGRLRVSQTVSDLLSLSAGGAFSRSRSEDVPNGGLNSNYGALTGFIFGPNTVDIQPDAEGNYPDLILQNPLDVIDNFDFNQTTNRFTGDVQATLTPGGGLQVNVVSGIDSYTQSGLALIPIGSTAGGFSGGFSRRADRTVLGFNNDLRLRYQTSLGEALESTTVLGGTSQFERSTVLSAQTRDLLPGIITIGGGGRPDPASEGRGETTLFGAFAQQTFGYADQLFVTLAGRVDASSVFGEGDRTNFYPKVSASYDAGSNPAYQRAARGTALPSTLRLRASYGQSGGLTAIGPFDRFTRYTPATYIGNGGLTPSGLLGNPGVKPERQTEIEGGADLAFFGGRLGLEATAYTQDVSDLLLFVELPLTTGFTNQLQNVGALSNNGVEVLLRGLPVLTQNVRWTTTATFATNQNRIDLNPDVTEDPDEVLVLGNSFGLVAVLDDQPQGVFYASQFYRDDAGNILGQAVTPAGLPATNADGTPVFVPATRDDDGVLRDEAGNVVFPVRLGTPGIIGDPNPDFTLSLINEVELGQRVSLRVQFDGSFGGDVFNFTRRLASLGAFGTLTEYQREIEGELPFGYNGNAAIPNTDGLRRGSFSLFEYWIEDGTYVKLREVSLSYLVPARYVRGLGLDGLRVTAYGRNLLSFDDYSGYDPETNVAGSSTGVRGYDFVEVPIPRTFGLTLRATL